MNNEPDLLQVPSLTEQPPAWWQGIRFRMILRFGGLFLMILLLLEFLYYWGIPALGLPGRLALEKENAFRMLHLLVASKTTHLQDWLAGHQELARVVASEPVTIARARDLGALAKSRSPDAYRQAAWDHPARQGLSATFQAVMASRQDLLHAEMVAADDGRILVSSDHDRLGQVMAFPDLLDMGSRDPDGFVHAIVRDRQGTHVLHVTYPMRGANRAVLVLCIATEPFLEPFLHTGPGLGQNGEILLVNDLSQPLVSLKHPLPDGTMARGLEFENQALPARLAALGGEGDVEALDYRQVPVLASVRHLRLGPAWGWGVVAKVDRAELLAPLQQEMFRLLVMGGIGMLAVILVTLLAASKVSRPLRLLTRTAMALAGGDLAARTGLVRQDEVGLLARTFDAMAQAMQQAVAVQSRQTERLHAAMAQLTERHQVQEATLAISRALSASTTLSQLLEQGLNQLMLATDSQAGAIYQRRGEGFILAASLGFQADRPLPLRIKPGEGAVGLAALRKAPQFLADLPTECRVAIPVLNSHIPPQGMACLPMVHQGETLAVALLVRVTPLAINQVEAVRNSLAQFAVSIANAESHAETLALAHELKENNRELKELNEELKSHDEALRQQTRELVVQQEQVEKANRLKSEFLSNMSHELRTPLNSILALSHLMIARAEQGPPNLEYLNIIERNGKRLLDLINDILDLSRIESGHMELFVDHVDLASMVQDVTDTMRPLAHAKGLELATQLTGRGHLRTDPDKTRQILLNLLSNAIKFTQQGLVQLTVTLHEAGATFAVQDSGAGIDPVDQERIFDSFTQLDGSTTRNHQGTGLGLAISRKLATLLGGSLTVQSSLGQGALFTLTLPNLPLSSLLPVQPAAGAGESQTRTTALAKVLVVDDNEVVRLQIRDVLAGRYQVVEAASAQEAQHWMANGLLPDLLILDLMMPGVDGFDLLNTLRAFPKTAQLPVLVLTARELTPADRAHLKANHVVELIQKGSVNREKLQSHVERALARTPPPAAARRLSPPAATGPAVLLVEDKDDNLYTLAAILSSLPCVLWTVNNGPAALTAVLQEQPVCQLILMDMELPGMSGFEVTRRLKADPRFASLPVVAVTARAMKGDREQCLAAGCVDYLPKPLDPERLLALVKKYILTES